MFLEIPYENIAWKRDVGPQPYHYWTYLIFPVAVYPRKKAIYTKKDRKNNKKSNYITRNKLKQYPEQMVIKQLLFYIIQIKYFFILCYFVFTDHSVVNIFLYIQCVILQ